MVRHINVRFVSLATAMSDWERVCEEKAVFSVGDKVAKNSGYRVFRGSDFTRIIGHLSEAVSAGKASGIESEVPAFVVDTSGESTALDF
jgi:hypothetical protein